MTTHVPVDVPRATLDAMTTARDAELLEPDDSTGSYDLEARGALRRVAGLSTELADVTEVEYRQLRLERVVLVGVWTEGTQADADRSLAELAALAETAGSQVLEAVSQQALASADYNLAEQTTMALEAIFLTLDRAGKVSGNRSSRMRAAIDEAYKYTNDAKDYRAGAYNAALRQFRGALP